MRQQVPLLVVVLDGEVEQEGGSHMFLIAAPASVVLFLGTELPFVC